jgi:AcrR family transcriptional regulator
VTASGTTTRRSSRKAKGDGYLRRAEILGAAERIFIVEGYDGATIRRIADEVGVSSTALYMHFPDKSAILHEICERTIEVLLERNRDIAGKPIDAVARVKMMLEAYMRWGIEHPNAYQLVYSVPRPAGAAWADDAAADLAGQCYDIFAGVVREIAADGRLRSGTGDSAAQALWMCCHGVVALLAARPKFAWSERDELIGVTLDGLINGLVVD